MALAKETKEHLSKVSNSAVTLQLAAEEAARRLTESVITDATEQLVMRVATRLESRAMATNAAASAIRETQEQLQDHFAAAMLEARSIARELAMRQLAVEAEPIVTAGYGLSLTPSLAPAEVEAMWARQAATSMSRKFGATAIAELQQWQGRKGSEAGLPRALARVEKRLEAERKLHSVTQSVGAFNEAKREQWGKLKEGRAKALPGRPSSPGAGKGGRGGSDDWSRLVREIWDAILDGKTCPVCWRLAGTMVEVGKPFPEGARTPAHGHCRCVIVTAFIPAEFEKYLPGAELDFDALKEDVRDYMGSRKFDVGTGVRHAKRFVDDVFAERHLGEHKRTGRFDISGSARELTRRMNDRSSYFPNIVQPRAPSLRW